MIKILVPTKTYDRKKNWFDMKTTIINQFLQPSNFAPFLAFFYVDLEMPLPFHPLILKMQCYVCFATGVSLLLLF